MREDRKRGYYDRAKETMSASARRHYQATWLRELIELAWQRAPGMRRRLEAAGLPPLANPVLDTWPLYDWLSSRAPQVGSGLPRLKDPRLPALAAALGVRCRAEHNALGDAFVTAQVFQRLLRRLDRWGVTTAGQLLRIGDPRRAHGRASAAPPLA